jgi:phage terminase small subunit
MTGQELQQQEVWGELGPAMQQLTERQRLFVRALVSLPPGYGILTKAYKAAGFGTPNGKRLTLAKNASALSKQENIIAAIAEESRKVIRTAFPEAVSALMNMIRDPSHKDHCRATMALIDRCDPLETKHNIDVVHRTVDPDREALEELRAARELGATREKLISLFGENALDKLLALEQLDNAKRAMAAKVIDGKETEQ